jgi:hypothetical protein
MSPSVANTTCITAPKIEGIRSVSYYAETMPSVMDFINFKTKFSRMGKGIRNTFITDSISWLESEERPRLQNPDHLSPLVNLENHLQSALNLDKVPETWFSIFQSAYGTFPFTEKLLRRLK